MRLGFVGLVLLLLCVGCGADVSVKGKVTFDDGKPLTKGRVVFTSMDSKYQAMGSLDADGRFSMEGDTAAGIKPGEYRVSLQSAHTGGDYVPGASITAAATTSPIVKLVNSKYDDPSTSEITFKVSSSVKDYSFKVTPP